MNPTKQYDQLDIKKAIEKRNLDYDWFTAVGKVKISSPDLNNSAKIYLRIQRGKTIWAVIKVLGIEMARVLMTPEKFTIIYRLENVYEEESFQTLLASYDADLSFIELQDYLVGNIPLDLAEELRIRENPNELVVQTTIKKMKSFLRFDLQNLHLNTAELYNNKNESVKASFSDYRQNGELDIPYKRLFVINSLEYGTMSANFKWSEIEINQPKSIKFSVPAHYERLKYYRPF